MEQQAQPIPQQVIPQQVIPQQLIPQQVIPQQIPQQVIPQQVIPQQVIPQQQIPQSDVQRTEGQQIDGTLKVWNVEKGYGFVVCEDGGSDLFVHQSAIKVDGDRYRAILPGTEVSCIYYLREGKETAREVTAKGGAALPGFASKLEVAQKLSMSQAVVAARPGMLTGTIKFMNREKGFGFIIPDAGGDEVFVHVQDVDGHIILNPGEPVSYATAIKKGTRSQAVQVTPLRPQQQQYPQHGYHQQQYSPYPPQPYDQYGYHTLSPYGGHHQQEGFGEYPPVAGASNGSVKWFNEQKGFGFIIPAAGGPDVYFKGSDVQGGGPLSENEPVVYETKTGSDGKVWAGLVRRQPGQKLMKQPDSNEGPFKRPQGAPLGNYSPYTNGSPQYGAEDQYDSQAAYGQNGYQNGYQQQNGNGAPQYGQPSQYDQQYYGQPQQQQL